jgi:hypothetical protein
LTETNNPPPPYDSIDEIEEVVRRFEAGTLGAGEFHHRQHLTVVLLYLWQFPVDEAAARMREGLYRFLAHHGIGRRKYHETITIFWLRKVCSLLDHAGESFSTIERANEVLKACDEARLIFEYYSQGLIDSDAARARWVEPDLRPLDF